MSRKDQQTLLGQRSIPTVVRNGTDGERSPFLAEPVRLTPAWEASNLPNDELNFKGMTMERAKMEISPPYDRFRLVLLTFMLHGLGTLIPWNMFITAKSYFVDFKLNESYTGEKSEYATNFLAYISFAAQIPNVFFNWLNIFVKFGGNLTTRIIWSILIEIILFVITVLLAMVDSSQWPGAFFWITMITVVLLNMANGIYQNTVYGMAAKLPIKYTGAVVLGSNISGLFATVIQIVSSTMLSSHRTAAIYYFITAMFVLLLCFDTYFALPLNRFYRYHELLHAKEAEKQKTDQHDTKIPYWTIIKQCYPQLFNVFMVFFVTLAIFPNVHSDIQATDENFFIPEKYFTMITCFLTFNFFAMVGSLITSWIQWPKPKYLVYPVLARLAFIPFFLLCNYNPRNISRTLPVLFPNDWLYCSMAILMSLSSGYLSSLAMMYAPINVESRYASTAGMFGAAFLITGIFVGALFTWLCPLIVQL